MPLHACIYICPCHTPRWKVNSHPHPQLHRLGTERAARERGKAGVTPGGQEGPVIAVSQSQMILDIGG